MVGVQFGRRGNQRTLLDRELTLMENGSVRFLILEGSLMFTVSCIAHLLF